MTIWKKDDVWGNLKPVAQKGYGRVARVYESIGEDVYITAIRDGKHMAGSFHPIGLAWDMKYPRIWSDEIKKRIVKAAGLGFQFVWHKTHIHVEYDIV